MLDLDQFVGDCRSALGEAQPVHAIKAILERAVADPTQLVAGDGLKPGVTILHRSAQLTVARVVVPPGAPQSLPHDHRMWALVGIYAGQEDNRFFRRGSEGLEPSGGRTVHASQTLAMGDDTIHAIHNPLTHSPLAAIERRRGARRRRPTSRRGRRGHHDGTHLRGQPGIRSRRRLRRAG